MTLRPLDPAAPALDRPRLSVVLVNYQRWDDTARLVKQLRRSRALRDGSAEVVVIDNASPGHPLVRRLRRTRGVTLVRWRENRGFARAANEGCRLGRGDWILLLNPDMTAPPGFLDRVLERADSLASRGGVVGFRLVHEDGSPQFSTGYFPTLGSTLTRLLLPRALRKYSHPEGSGPREVDWVTGCCMLVRRRCWEELGGLDPAFFLYYEDVDFCRRARGAGWSVWFDPSATVMHHRPLHAREVPPHLRLVTRHALLTYAGKHWPAWQRAVLGGVVKMEAGLRWLAAWLRGDQAASTFGEMGRVAADLGRGENASARARLVAVVRSQERSHAAPIEHRRPQPQPARPAPRLPGERHAPCPAADGMAGR
ncbi:MAG: glycosyltransferase family 2 protein [Gemmataceae bacterium]|nr:glycosyltransferase family 2 protein [Gemmataceae bacterium]